MNRDKKDQIMLAAQNGKGMLWAGDYDHLPNRKARRAAKAIDRHKENSGKEKCLYLSGAFKVFNG